MVNTKASAAMGSEPSEASWRTAPRNGRGRNAPESDFASFLPPPERIGAPSAGATDGLARSGRRAATRDAGQIIAPPVESARQAGLDHAPVSMGRRAELPMGGNPRGHAAIEAQQSMESLSGPGGRNARLSLGAYPASPARTNSLNMGGIGMSGKTSGAGGGVNFSAANAMGLGPGGMNSGQRVMNSQAGGRIVADRPVTGRGNFGMVDTRAAGRTTLTGRGGTNFAGPNTTAGRGLGMEGGAPARDAGLNAVGLGQNGRSAQLVGRPDALSSYTQASLPGGGQNFATHGFAGRNAEFALQSVGYDPADIRAATLSRVLANDSRPLQMLNGVQFPNRREGAVMAVQVSSHRQRYGAPEGARFTPAAMQNGYSQDIGSLAAKFESGAEGISAIGYDRVGGTSYGKYQISSRAGTMRGFISYLQDKAPDVANRLESAGPANTGGRGGRMPAVWREIAAENPTRFEALQADFIKVTHFEPAMKSIQESTGVSFQSMPPALQEVLFSTAVQHGPAGAVRIVSQALNNVGAGRLNRPGDQQAGRQLIEHIYSLRSNQFMSSTSSVQAAARSRMSREKQEALAMLS